MARLPPHWIQAGNYSAQIDRRLMGALWPTGAVRGMSASVQASTMNVLVQWGQATVPDHRAVGASFLCSSDGTETVPIPPADAQDRIDLVVVRPRDSVYGGADNDWIYDVIGGTPGASPVVPAVPDSTAPVFQIRIVGGSAFLTAANLVDRRQGIVALPDAVDTLRAEIAALRSGAYGGQQGRGDASLAAGDQAFFTIAVPAPPGPSTLSVWAYGMFGFVGSIVSCQPNIRRTSMAGTPFAASSSVFQAPASVRATWIVMGRTDLNAGEALTFVVSLNLSLAQWTNGGCMWEVKPR